ncbi:hypothetical protein P7C70_g5708, partial [Phenoliferia sp. Uapishka_3]
MEPFFWTLVNALTEKDFERVMSKYAEKGKAPARYLDKIPHNKWAEYAFPGARYGRVLSNIAEISNAFLKDARRMAPLTLLTTIEEWGMGKFAERSTRAEARVDEFTAAATARFVQEEAASREYNVVVSTNRAGSWSGLVKHPLSHSADHEVTITIPFETQLHRPTGLPYLSATCTCGFPQDHLMPCRHAIALASRCKLAPRRLVDEAYTTFALQHTYSNPYPVVSTAGLEPDANVLPPSKKRKVGRPRTKRMEAGDGKGKKRQRCGSCGGFGHLKSKCPRV